MMNRKEYMTETLPEPESRKESYLAKAAGMTVETLPTPASREELYLNAIAQGGGGGGTSDFNDLTNRPKYNGTAMTGETDIPVAPTVVQTTGMSETDVMSQDATTNMVFGDNSAMTKIKIGNRTYTTGDRTIAIGNFANAPGKDSLAIGAGTGVGQCSYSPSEGGIAIGYRAKQSGGPGGLVGKYGIAIGYLANTASAGDGAISLGAYSNATQKGQMDISTLATTNTYGYNNSQYRLLTGLYDGQTAHDAATYGQLNTRLDGLTLLKISQTDYDNLSTYDANTLYVITGA